MPSAIVPRRVIATLAFAYALFLAGWLFLLRAFDDAHWVVFLLSAVIAALFVSFGVSLVGALRLVGTEHPAWLNKTQAAYIAVVGFALQSSLAGALTLAGAWPHKDLWFLGAIPFLWRG